MIACQLHEHQVESTRGRNYSRWKSAFIQCVRWSVWFVCSLLGSVFFFLSVTSIWLLIGFVPRLDAQPGGFGRSNADHCARGTLCMLHPSHLLAHLETLK